MYITGVRGGYGSDESSIQHYRWSMRIDGRGTVEEVTQFFRKTYNRSETYQSYNPNTKHFEDLEVKEENGKKFFVTDSRDTSTYLTKLPQV